jgi:hypothetical protein
MKEVSVRTIERWHTELEKQEFIKRDTWREHIKDPDKGLIIKSKRKIYVFENSKKVAEPPNSGTEPPKLADRSEPPKLADRSEPPKLAGINKEPVNSKSLTLQPVAPSARVCPEKEDSLLCIEDLGNLALILSHREAILKECQETSSDAPISTKKLVERVIAWEDRKCGDFSACKTILAQWDVWQDIETAQSKQKKEEEKKIVEIDKSEVRKHRLIRLAQQVPSLGWQVRSLCVERKIVQNGRELVVSIYFNDSEKDKLIDELEEKFNLKSAH